ncbi:MAG: sugar-binding protein, partial [Chloroflexota bacterium]
LEVEAMGAGVFFLHNGQPTALAPGEPMALQAGQGVAVEDDGAAAIRYPDLLTMELRSKGRLILTALSTPGGAATIGLRQSGGILLADFNPEGLNDRELIIETEFATITTRRGSFMLVREPNMPLEWVVNLSQPEHTLQVTAGGQTRSVSGDAARRLSPDDPPGDSLAIDPKRLQAWYNSLKSGQAQLTLSEVLLAPANMIGLTAALPSLPRLGQPFELARSEQGAVKLTLDPIGLFGNPTYTLEDCNADGAEDIAIRSGKVRFDFRPLLARVLALDVTLVNRAEAGQGSLWGADAAGDELDRMLVAVAPGQSDTLSLRSERSERPFHTAELALSNGCFVGFSLTPPSAAGASAEPRPAVTSQPPDVVVNILEEPKRVSTAPPVEALPLETGQALKIDGRSADWDALFRAGGLAWTRVDAPAFDRACANRYPGSSAEVDLAGQVGFAYDEHNLYVAFRVEDDGLVGYAGAGENYFLGDAPQLSLDMDLAGDIDQTTRNQDDWQVDFLPDLEKPRVALWQLGSLTSRPFDEAPVAASTTPTGYFLEAALPWSSLDATPRPGEQLGLAANINDNDTPGGNAQECIISTAPERQWDNPTTWGVLLLKP